MTIMSLDQQGNDVHRFGLRLRACLNMLYARRPWIDSVRVEHSAGQTEGSN